jgi:hypothetical protein
MEFIASEANTIHRYKSLREKLMKCNANILLNKVCLSKNITPSYAKLKIPKTSPAAKNTQHKAQILRIKEEIKFLYCKKNHLNQSYFNITVKPHMGSQQATG